MKEISDFRITSTYVENTTVPYWQGSGTRDHLHIRGEYANVPEVETVDNRITSTYVENTLPMKMILVKQQDHLHIRGEYSIELLTITSELGSPPHTWRILFAKYL